jgi:putative membrane protein
VITLTTDDRKEAHKLPEPKPRSTAAHSIDDPRVWLAAERTFLAWIRTGVALMGFGFVVARFGLFLRELAAAHQLVSYRRTGLSLWLGTGLLIIGIGVNVGAAVQHVRLLNRLNRGEILDSYSGAALGVAMILAVLGVAMVVNLVLLNQ